MCIETKTWFISTLALSFSAAASEKEGWHPINASRGKSEVTHYFIIATLLQYCKQIKVEKYWFWRVEAEAGQLTQHIL